MTRSSALPALAALAFVTACPDRPVAKIDPRPTGEIPLEVLVSNKLEVDILFVIDNSVSMGNEQTALRNNFPAFMQVLEGVEGGLPDVHIGVVSSDMGSSGNKTWCENGETTRDGDNGILRTGRSGCAGLSGRFISSTQLEGGGRDTNFSGTLEDAFACIAELGTTGCGFEQHLEAMRAGLDNRSGQNTGFLREDALLAVIFIADEDDCSYFDDGLVVDDDAENADTSEIGPQTLRCTQWGVTCDQGDITRDVGRTYTNCRPRDDSPYLTKTSEFAEFLVDLKGGKEKIFLAAIAGRAEPFQIVDDDGIKLESSCPKSPNPETGRLEGAVPPVRILSLLGAFTESVEQEICSDDLTPALVNIAEALGRKFRLACLPAAADVTTDLFDDNPGIQPECSVIQKTGDLETPVRRCQMDDPTTPEAGQEVPCWYLRPVVGEECATGVTQVLEVLRDREPPPGTLLNIACAGTIARD